MQSDWGGEKNREPIVRRSGEGEEPRSGTGEIYRAYLFNRRGFGKNRL
jgi:hypothetical protein